MALAELELADYRRRVAAAYARARDAGSGEAGWGAWRAERDELFTTHPQTPVPPARRPSFEGMAFFEHDPAARHVVEVEPLDGPAAPLAMPHSGEGSTTLRPVARVRLAGGQLVLYWLEAYGGGLFLPFRDATSGAETYGGGRYLLDTVKGADLGAEGDRLVLDLNYAYSPSCAHDPRWSCPLAPPESRLDIAVRAGERTPHDE